MEVSVNGHRVDLHYVGYSHVNEFEFKERVFTSGFAPMIKVDGKRAQLGEEVFPTITEAKANAKHYLAEAELSEKFSLVQGE